MATDLFYPERLKDALDKSYLDDSAISAIQFKIFTRPDSQSSQLDSTITLYIPENMENPTNVSWDSAAAQMAGESILREQSNWGNNVDRAIRYAKEYGTGLVQSALGGSDMTGKDVYSLKTKQITNPYLKMLFRGVNFRNFEYMFRFTPHNQDESKQVFEIIQRFRKAALPSGDADSPFLGYPNEVEIEYLYQESTHPWLNKFKRCVITDLNVNYTGAGFYATMRDGFPAQTELRMRFSEIEILTQKDIEYTGPSY